MRHENELQDQQSTHKLAEEDANHRANLLKIQYSPYLQTPGLSKHQPYSLPNGCTPCLETPGVSKQKTSSLANEFSPYVNLAIPFQFFISWNDVHASWYKLPVSSWRYDVHARHSSWATNACRSCC